MPLIGDLLRRSRQQGDTEVLMLSDHGFGPVRQEIYINPILQRYGFFSLDTEAGPGRSLEGIGGRAKALAIDPARIFIHLRDKFPRGRVALRDYEKIRGELRELFENYKVNGRKAIRRVFYREELYSPPLRQQAADIVLLANPGFDLKAGADKKEESGLNHFTGMHTQDDAFCFCTRPDLLPDPLTICDVKSVIEKLLAD